MRAKCPGPAFFLLLPGLDEASLRKKMPASETQTCGLYGSVQPEGFGGRRGKPLPCGVSSRERRQLLALCGAAVGAALLVAAMVAVRAPAPAALLSEWDIDSDETPAAIAERRHPPAGATKQMLMFGNVELPSDNFSWKKESGEPQCEDKCAFRDKVFTVEGFDQLCIAHCGEVDAILRAASKGQRAGIQLAQRTVRQQLALKAAKGQKLADAKRGEAWYKTNTFNKKGYWPVDGNKDALAAAKVNVDHGLADEKEMSEQHSTETITDGSFYTHFLDTGHKLKKAGVHVAARKGKRVEHGSNRLLSVLSGFEKLPASEKSKVVQLESHEAAEEKNFKDSHFYDKNFKAEGYWPLSGEPNKLAHEGMNLDAWPAGAEHPMPEQYSHENPTQLEFYQHFFDTGSRLNSLGVNMKKNPMGDEHVKGDDGKFKAASVNMYNWPWDPQTPSLH